ncbi:MAG: hypothetical protein IH612_15900, partial [Desulfofustis sp.]|nr:hypothetical protein [Desulfofustis sp.]
MIVLLAALVLTLITPIDQARGDESPTPAAVQSRFREMHRDMVRSGITPEEAEATIRAMETNRFTHQQMVRVGALMEEDRKNSAHSEVVQAIRGKVHEGIVKGIDPDRIIEAAAKVAGRVRTSTALARSMNLQAKQALASVYADSLAAGLTED